MSNHSKQYLDFNGLTTYHEGTKILHGYYNSSNGNFYKESTYTTLISPQEKRLYIDLGSDIIYEYKNNTYVALTGTGNYNNLSNKPSINSVPLSGNKTTSELGLAAGDHTHSNASTTNAGFMSASDKTKLNGIASGAQVNVIETIKVNNSALTPSSKAVNISVPTKVSELTNDSGYTTNTGTVTSVKVGSTSYNPESGVVSLPAYPTTLPASDVSSWAKASTKPSYTASEVGAIASTAKGIANGVAELDAGGKVPSSQLPSYVDDVLEYNSKSSFPTTGETGKIYVDTSTNLTYRWSGTTYVEISPSLALGETSSTAYYGDKGKTAYDHSQSTHARTDATKTEASSTNGNIKINGTETTVYTHPGTGTNPHGTTASDVGLGNVGNFKAVSTVASQGLTNTEKSNARANIGAGTSSLAIGTTASTAAAGNHTHTTTLATDSGTATVTLARDTTYKLTAGDTNIVFKTPASDNTDTKNTTGSTDTSSKIFLVGATSQATNPQTYSHDTVYVGTDGHVYSNSKQVVNLSDSQALTNKTYNGYTLGTACAKDIPSSGNASSTQVVMGNDTRLTDSRTPTSHAHGNIANGGTISSTAVTPANGDYLLMSDTSNSGKVERGIAIGTDTTKYLRNDGTWVVPPNNNTTYTFANGTNGFTVTPSGGSAQTVTVTPSISKNVTGAAAWTAADVITTTNASSGNVIKASGKTIATSVTGVDTTVPTSNAVKTFVEGKGYVTTDTKNTAGSTDTSSKIYLIGATSQATNPQTYSDNEVYVTNGVLTTKSVQVGGTSATMQYNSTTQAIEFVFS